MRLNTAPALDVSSLSDVAALADADVAAAARSSAACRSRCCAGTASRGFSSRPGTKRSIASPHELRRVDPDACRVLPDVARHHQRGLLRRAEGRALSRHPHVDNSARLCHAASTSAMKAMLGHGASTCSYADWLHADLIVLFGSNVANNQPVAMKYLRQGQGERRADRRREPVSRARAGEATGCRRSPRARCSAATLADHWFDVHTGGDRAFLTGVLRALIEIERRGRARSCASARSDSRPRATRCCEPTGTAIEQESGASQDDDARVCAAAGRQAQRRVRLVDGADTACARRRTRSARWSTSALARGLPGRPNRGLVPIRGHSGVQGGAEVGCVPTVDAATAARWSEVWEFPVSAGARLDRRRDDRPRRRRRRRSVLDRRRQFSRDPARCGALAARAACGRGCAFTTTSCCRRRCWWTATATCCSCRRRRATNPKAAAPKRRPSAASSFRRRFPGGGSGARKPGMVGVRRSDGARVAESRELHPLRQRRGDPRRNRAARCRSIAASKRWRRKAIRCSGAARRLFADGSLRRPDGKAQFAVDPAEAGCDARGR